MDAKTLDAINDAIAREIAERVMAEHKARQGVAPSQVRRPAKAGLLFRNTGWKSNG